MSRLRSDLTKEILEEAYLRLGSLRRVALELQVDRDTVKRWMNSFEINYDRLKRIPHFKAKRTYECNHVLFSEESEESFYWAGFIAADGSINDHNQLTVALAIKDVNHLIKLKKSLNATYKIKESVRKLKDKEYLTCLITITSKQLCKDLRERFNVIPRKSLIYTMPEWIKDHPLRHHFIRGYVDGDGCFFVSLSTNKKRKKYGMELLGTLDLLTSIKDIFKKDLDFKKEKNIGKDSRCEIRRLSYNGNQLFKKIYTYLYQDATVYLDRKKIKGEGVFGNLVVEENNPLSKLAYHPKLLIS